MCVQCSYFHCQEAPRHDDTGDPSSEMWNLLGEKLSGNLAESNEFHATLGIFYMPQIYDMGQMALLPLRRKSCWGFFRPEKSDGFVRVWTRKLGY
jgi:hypothetical protein